MGDSLKAKWPVTELSATQKANGSPYLSAKQTSDLYEMAYSTFMKRLKDFVEYGKYPPAAFRVSRRLRPKDQGRAYWIIQVHPVWGIRALNRHFYPRLAE